MAFTLGFTRSICFRCAASASRALNFLRRMSAAISTALRKQRSGVCAERVCAAVAAPMSCTAWRLLIRGLLDISVTRSHRRILDSELLQVGVVLGRVVIEGLHAWPELIHSFLIEPDGRLVLRTQKALIFNLLGLDVVVVVPGFLDEIRMRED